MNHKTTDVDDKPLINRVANSGLITLNLEDFFPEMPMIFDIKDYLFQGLILKEKEFRKILKTYDWTQYESKALIITCSTDAIIPVWAYMLITSYAKPYASEIFVGEESSFFAEKMKSKIQEIDTSHYDEKRIVIKGCSKKPVPPAAYAELTRILIPYAQSIMYGEPCSTVPIFKRPRRIVK